MSVWISRNQVIARLREANWQYSTQTKRVEIYKLKGSPKRMDVPIKDYFPDVYARILLKQAGLTRDQIEEFLKAAVKK